MRAERDLGPYTLLDQIAVGGMAEIYLAKTKGVAGFEKHCALKIILPEYASDESFVQMLIDEAKIAVGLNHTNIAQIFELGRYRDTYYIAMEYVDGADLFRIMRSLSNKSVMVPIQVAAYLAQEICTGLHYAHTRCDRAGKPRQIIHRDISPQNILVSYAGEVKIVDFGIAKAASRTRKTQTGVIKGKYFYMSPEQAWGDTVDHRTDVFSAGIVLYEVLTGRMLYTEENMSKLLHLARQAEIPPPTVRRPGIPPQLVKIVMKALERRPEDRWQTAGEFQAAITSFLFSYAPDFTPDQVADLVRAALDEADEDSAARQADRSAGSGAGWREVPSPLPAAASAGFDDRTPIDSGLGGPDSGDDVDRTMVSGPPQMTPGFASDPDLKSRESLWDDDTWPHSDTRDEVRRRLDGATANPPEVIVAAPPGADGADGPAHAVLTAERGLATRPHLGSDPGPGEISDSVLSRMEPTVVSVPGAIPALSGPARRKNPPPSSGLAERHAAGSAVPATAAPSLEGADDLADTRPRMAVAHAAGQPTDGQAPNADPAQAADPTESATAGIPVATKPARRKAWRAVFLAFVLTVTLAGITIGVVIWGLPRLESSATLEVISVPEGATVELDGKKLAERTRLVITIADSTRDHQVRVSLPDYEDWTSPVRFDPDERHKQLIASLVPQFGRLLVESVPSGAEVLLNGEVVGRTPLQREKLSLQAKPKLEVRLPGYETERRLVKWGDQSWQRVKVVLRRARGR